MSPWLDRASLIEPCVKTMAFGACLLSACRGTTPEQPADASAGAPLVEAIPFSVDYVTPVVCASSHFRPTDCIYAQLSRDKTKLGEAWTLCGPSICQTEISPGAAQGASRAVLKTCVPPGNYEVDVCVPGFRSLTFSFGTEPVEDPFAINDTYCSNAASPVRFAYKGFAFRYSFDAAGDAGEGSASDVCPPGPSAQAQAGALREICPCSSASTHDP